MTSRKRPASRRAKSVSDSPPLRLIVNGEPTEIRDVPATTTLLDWLREHAGLKGTKEGCAEGDCGACTVVVERLARNGAVVREPINACISMIGQLDGLAIRTVEGLSAEGGPLHPVQAALAEGGATQCGFCTPGFVMSAYAFAAGGEPREAGRIHDALAGNLCRCTGYRPIVDALLKTAPPVPDPIERTRSKLAAALKSQARRAGARFEHQERWFHAPATFREALTLRAKYPDAVVLAGGTDVGLRVSRQREVLPAVIHVGRIASLTAVKEDKQRLVFGASVTCASALDVLAKHYPGLHVYLTRFGSRQIRSMATLAGNIATASPIGDTLPILLALDARIKVRSARGTRTIDADKFFTGYRRTVLAKDELIESIAIPKPSADTVLFADKISKRRDQDISTLCGVYRLRIAGGIIRDVRLAFGGMAATPRRARKAEAALLGQRLDAAGFAAAGGHVADEFAPISDWRGSAEYRRAVAKNLLQRLHLRLTSPGIPLEIDAL